jgi:hypothetical protein
VPLNAGEVELNLATVLSIVRLFLVRLLDEVQSLVTESIAQHVFSATHLT